MATSHRMSSQHKRILNQAEDTSPAGFFALSGPATKEEQLSGERAWRHNLKISMWFGPFGAELKRTLKFVTCGQ